VAGMKIPQRVYDRHRFRVEGAHGEAKTQHGLRRAIRRGLANVAIRVYLIAAVINLKRLAKMINPSYVPYFWFYRRIFEFIAQKLNNVLNKFHNKAILSNLSIELLTGAL